jgi:hypothetical protein
MKFYVVFGKGDADLFSTNISQPATAEQLFANGNTVLSYTLNDLPLTKKFVNYWQQYTNQRIGQRDNFFYHYNYYPNVTVETLTAARKDMNAVIDELNTLGVYIDPALKLSETVLEDPESDKTNELHFRFESELVKINFETPNYSRLFYLLEKVNNLVHFVELTPTSAVAWENLRHASSFNMAVRTTGPQIEYEPLVDEDYADFTLPVGGDLVCDFATVGKDLFVVSCTNDMELVRRGEVKQQSYLTDFTFMNFNCFEFDQKQIDRHYLWCEKNYVDRYLDFRAPRYNPGRHVLGHIDQPIRTGQDFLEHVILKTPIFLGRYIADDAGNILTGEHLI